MDKTKSLIGGIREIQKVPEQQARDLLERLGVENAQSYTSGDLVELANLFAALMRLEQENLWLKKALANYREVYSGISQ